MRGATEVARVAVELHYIRKAGHASSMCKGFFCRPRLEILACIRLSISTIQIPFSGHLQEQ
jgi:hypothetical protein